MNINARPTTVSRRWYQRLLLCVLSFLLVLGVIGVVYYVLGMEPFGVKTVSIDDAKIQYIDFFTYYVDVLHGTRSITYDFANMLGGSSIGLFSYYLASPFNFLLYFFGKEGVYRFFNVAAALKLALAGATFSWYLQRRFADRIRSVFVVALSVGYALMQYSIAQSSNIMWLDGVYMLPLILLGVYEVLHRKSVWRLALAVGFCILCNWYIAGVICLFSGIWFFFEFAFCGGTAGACRDEVPAAGSESAEYVSGDDAGISVNDASGASGTSAASAGPDMAKTIGSSSVPIMKKTAGSLPESSVTGISAGSAGYDRKSTGGFLAGITDFVVSFCRYVWGMGLGIGLSAVLFLPAVSAMRQGKGQYEEIKILFEMSGDLLSSVRGYVIGTESTRGFAALFCGGIAVFCAAAFFFSASSGIREKISYLCMLGICFLMLHWEPAMLAFSLMKRADSYWYRYSSLVCFVLLFGAGACLSRAGRDKWTRIFIPLTSILYAAAVLKLNGIHLADFMKQPLELMAAHKTVFATVVSSVVLSLLVLFLVSVKKLRALQFVAGLLLLAVTAAETGTNAWLFWRDHMDDSQELYMAYSAGMQEQLRQLREADDGYYRIAQDRTRWHYEDDLTAYFNDSLAQNYWSNAAYTSSPENTQLSLMWRLGYRDEAGCMMIVRDPMLAADSFLGVRYMLQSTPIEGLEPVEGVESFNGRTVYRNPYALPFAFKYDGSKLPTRRYVNAYVYQNALFSTLSGKEAKIFVPLDWTRQNEGNKAYFKVFVPEGRYLVYGNLLWSEKMGGLLSINGDEPFGYCRWMSPASFLIRSREEQAQAANDQSLQAVRAAQKAAEEADGTETTENADSGDPADKYAGEAAAESAGDPAKMPAAESADDSAGTAAAESAGDPAKMPAAASADDSAGTAGTGAAGSSAETDDTAPVEMTTAMKKEELTAAAKAFDAEALKALQGSGYSDVRTVVFRTEKGLSFKDYQFYGLDLQALQDVVDLIKIQEVSQIHVENGHVTAHVDGRKGQSLCLLVPYSKGWAVTRNGDQVQADTVAGTMITVPLTDGENAIELIYTIPYLREGKIISAAALVVLLIDILTRWLTRRRKRSV